MLALTLILSLTLPALIAGEGLIHARPPNRARSLETDTTTNATSQQQPAILVAPGGNKATVATSTQRPVVVVTPEIKHAGNVSQHQLEPLEKNFVCLYSAYAAYRDGLGRFTTDKIDPFLCTHIIHGSFTIAENNTIESAHSDIDYDTEPGSFGLLKQLAALKKVNPNLKTLISVGSMEVTSGEFSQMAMKPESRRQFIESVLNFLHEHNLDGVDINWQFPASFTGDPADKENFVTLLEELGEALHGQRLLLSAQVAAAHQLISLGYDIPNLSRPLDLILLMAYDYNEKLGNKTTHIAPLYPPKYDRMNKENVKWSLEHWISRAPRDKLVLGVTSYAFAYTLDSNSQHGVGAPASQPGEEGKWTKNSGLLGYNEVCSIMREERGRWARHQDEDAKAYYAVSGDQWISFERRADLARKTKFALSRKISGVALYALDTDDFLGTCHNVTFPLARAIREALGLKAVEMVSAEEDELNVDEE